MVATAVKARRYRPLFLIDIAVPRDIQRACGALDDVYLYDIDDLEEVSRTNAEGRAEAAEAAKKLIEMELQKWARLGSERQVAPTIRQLREHFLAVATAEVDKTLRMLPELEEASALKVQKLAEVVVGRMLRAPIRALKDAAGAGEAERLAAVVHELFDLENGPDES
jgi:glutamyl-tRNA reductase